MLFFLNLKENNNIAIHNKSHYNHTLMRLNQNEMIKIMVEIAETSLKILSKDLFKQLTS
ncbi:MAG: hypothetical protein IAA31_05290 [Candidatus Anaerobiospirillum merdipullorum]|uniref:Uncharacterized protein n=1 Tax=Candidatus Anaerobiospirillum merdipullorum TaxID=2838450 RepID=A0A9E2KMP4_9GAMM|nr:hypothetical protein [Candidatus Anaerobiospirillum merdipullorum]